MKYTNSSGLIAVGTLIVLLVVWIGLKVRGGQGASNLLPPKVVVSWNKDGYAKHIEFRDNNGLKLKALNTFNAYQITTTIQSSTVTNFCIIFNYDSSGNQSPSVIKSFVLN